MSRMEPFKEFMSLRQALDRLFEESVLRPTRRLGDSTSGTFLPVDVIGTPSAIIVHSAIPGVEPEDVEITIEGSTVTIRGELKPPKDEGTLLIQEQPFGPFERIIELGMPVRADQAEAIFRNGVMTLTIPKAEDVKPRVIQVKKS